MPSEAWQLVVLDEARRAGDTAQRRREGAFYTPRGLAERVANAALGPLVAGRAARDLAAVRILDPAVGGGAFLLAAIELLVRAGLAPQGAASCVSAIDRDAEAAAIAGEAVRLHTGGACPAIRVADTLLEDAEPRYDAILGNPPWEKIARDDPRRRAFETIYADVREGEINLHALFLVWALRSLKPGGRLTFITPNTWLLNRWDAKLRAFVLAHDVEEVALLPAGTFPDTPITVPAVITIRRPGATTLAGGRIKASAPGFESACEASVWRSRPFSQMSVFDDARLAAIDAEIRQHSVPLGTIARASDGIYTSTARAHVFWPDSDSDVAAAADADAGSDRPRRIFLSGTEVSRDLAVHRGAWIPGSLWRLHADAQECPRLALHAARHPSLDRRLVGAVLPAGLYTSNRFINVRSDGEDIWFLAAVLLSRPIDGYFARRFPVADIDAFMLAQLPVPATDPQTRAHLAAAARLRASLRTGLYFALVACAVLRVPCIGLSSVIEALVRLEAAIDAEVAGLLGLDAEDIAFLAVPARSGLIGSARRSGV
jgi:SAM-dependent methyltransferase